MRFLMESHCERWMSMSMEVVIQMKWLFYKIIQTKEPRVHYKVVLCSNFRLYWNGFYR
jgi:hypothetical protein